MKLFTVGFFFICNGQGAFAKEVSLSNDEPSREWLGIEYANTLFTEFQKLYPGISLIIDEMDLKGIDTKTDDEKKWSLTTAAASFLKSWRNPIKDDLGVWTSRERLVTATREALPKQVNELTTKLEFGEPLKLNIERSKLLESRLKKWLDQGAKGAEAPHRFMIEALRLTNGRVIAAWALAWNVIAENWVMAATRNYSPLHSKMVSLTGERNLWHGGAHYIVLPKSEWTDIEVVVNKDGIKEMVKSKKRLQLIITKRGDDFSYLYHRIGIELYTMFVAKISGSARLGWVMGSAGALGEFLKYPATAGLRIENKKRINNDIMSAKSGARFFQLVTGEVVAPPQFDYSAANYLKPNVTKYGPRYQLPNGHPPEYFKIEVDSKFWAPSMTVEELLMRFYHATRVDSEIFNPILLASNGDAERLHRGLADYIDQGAQNNELNKYIDEYRNGVVAKLPVFDVRQDLYLDLEFRSSPFLRQVMPEYDLVELENRLLNQLDKVMLIAQTSNEIKAAEQSKDSSDTKSVDPNSRFRIQAVKTCKDFFAN